MNTAPVALPARAVPVVPISKIREHGSVLVKGTKMEASFYPPTNAIGKTQKEGIGIYALWMPYAPRSKNHGRYYPVGKREVLVVPDTKPRRS